MALVPEGRAEYNLGDLLMMHSGGEQLITADWVREWQAGDVGWQGSCPEGGAALCTTGC